MLKTTAPGFCAVEVAGEPPGKIQEYLAAVNVVPKVTDWPAVTVASDAGEVMVPRGGVVV